MNRRDLCLALIRADSEGEVIALLHGAGFWGRQEAWRHYGDIENNWATIGNQQSSPEAALVEKLVNSVDARLISACRQAGIDPESAHAPQSIREAVSVFFDPQDRPSGGRSGLVSQWPNRYRTQVAREITLAATGAKPGQGYPCLTISDRGEGQAPNRFPETLLSMHRSNKLRIPFVQGKFNMGGTGALRFCGKDNLQLVVSRRNPALLQGTKKMDGHWGFTVVRRQEEGGRNTVYSYLAPIGCKEQPRRGGVLRFPAESLPILPSENSAYERGTAWGTLIKLYEYQIKRRSHILLGDGLLGRLDLLLHHVALPIRLHECRDYRGKDGYESNLTGIRVRLEDNRGENLEFDPSSVDMKVQGQFMRAVIFAFKKGKADTYRSDEGIIFTVNGQTHGHLPTSFFRRQNVGMSYLRDSILVAVDCSEISARTREELFMNSRDRLAHCDLRNDLERELERILRTHPGLCDLRERRRREEVEARVAEDKPLEDVIRNLLSTNPTLAHLLRDGRRMRNPFRPKGTEHLDEPFSGNRYPGYFHFKGKKPGERLSRECQIGKQARIEFETDVENGYFSREVDQGIFSLVGESGAGLAEVEDYSLSLNEGIATLNITLPSLLNVGDQITLVAHVNDPTQIEPFKNELSLLVSEQTTKPPGPPRPPKVPGVRLPTVREVFEKEWAEFRFDRYTALQIKHAPSPQNPQSVDNVHIYDFFVNMDNLHVKSFLKQQTRLDEIGARLVRSQFKYGLVLLGLALLKQDPEMKGISEDDVRRNGEDSPDIESQVETFSQAAAAVLLPVIRSLGELELGDENDS